MSDLFLHLLYLQLHLLLSTLLFLLILLRLNLSHLILFKCKSLPGSSDDIPGRNEQLSKELYEIRKIIGINSRLRRIINFTFSTFCASSKVITVVSYINPSFLEKRSYNKLFVMVYLGDCLVYLPISAFCVQNNKKLSCMAPC